MTILLSWDILTPRHAVSATGHSPSHVPNAEHPSMRSALDHSRFWKAELGPPASHKPYNLIHEVGAFGDTNSREKLCEG
jgi:hypothetical protein